MAEAFDPDAYLAAKAPAFDPDAYLTSRGVKPDRLPLQPQQLASVGSDIWPEIKRAGGDALSTIMENLNPWSETAKASNERMKNAPLFSMEGMSEELNRGKSIGRGLAAIPEFLASPFTGAARSVIGHSLATVPDPRVSTTSDPQAQYEAAKKEADLAMMALAPGRGFRTVPVPPRPPTGPLGVTLSEGQATRNLAAFQREQAALRDANAPGHAQAQAFDAQQQAELAGAREAVARGLDPGAGIVAETPQEAGQYVSQTMRAERNRARAGVDAAYDAARGYEGEIHAGAFEQIGQKIKGDLSLGSEPVIIDSRTTPHAAQMIDDIDQTISRMRIPNKADPFGPPNPENITGINLTGVDQIRRRMRTFVDAAFGSGNRSDGRAAKAILDAFDARVDAAMNGGLFRGDPAAPAAWNAARRAHADYRSRFFGGKDDSVGRKIEQIVGKGRNDPLTPNDVIDAMLGSSGANPSTVNVGLSRRVRDILGEQSPEWTAVKQGLFQRLVNSGENIADWGPKKIADRLNKFLTGDGREMAEMMFAPHERQLLQSYADLMRHLEVPQAGANWSNTATFTAPLLRAIGNRIGTLISAGIGGAVGHAMHVPLIGEVAGAAVAQGVGAIGRARAARQVASQMPLVAEQMRTWQRAVARANRLNSPPSQAALAVASSNLARSLGRIGVPFRYSHAEGEKQDVPRPLEQHAYGGRVGKKPNLASGGKVVRLFHPKQLGARRAKDGGWYLPDPDREGKYIRVDRRRNG